MDETLKMLGIDTNGIPYEDLQDDELKTLHAWIGQLESNELTISKIIENITEMKMAVTQKIIDTPETVRVCFIFVVPNRESVLLRARLQNYTMLEAFLTGPQKAKEALQNSINNLKK